MATKYDLPQFRTPTQEYRRMPIIRTPNYGEIYAKSFLAGQQMGEATFAPIIAAIEKKAKEKKVIEKTVDNFDAQLDISIEKAFDGTNNADTQSRKLFNQKADILSELKKQSLRYGDKKPKGAELSYKEKYDLAFKTFKDDLRNWNSTTSKMEELTTILTGPESNNLSNFQNNSFLMSLKEELVENKGQGLQFRLNEELKDEMFFKDAYGQDVVVSMEFLSNADFSTLLHNKANFSKGGAENELFQTLSEQFNTSGTIGMPEVTRTVQNIKEGVTATTAGVVYSEAQKDNIKSNLLTDKKFQEIYADGSIAKSKFVHDWILTDNSTETLSIAREKIKVMAKASGVELNEFSDQMIETLLFTYGIDNENITEEEQILMDSVDGYIDSQIADYFFKQFYAPNERRDQTSIDVTPVEDKKDDPIKTASGNTLALLNNLDTNGGIIDQIAKFHSLVEEMGSFKNAEGEIIDGGRGRLNEYIVEQFGFDLPPEARFDQIGLETEEGVYEEYQYYINDLMVSSKDDYYENAYKFFKFKGSDLTRNQVKTLLELHAAKTALPQIGLRNKYDEYRNQILNNAKNKYTTAGGNVDELFADFEKRRLENFRD